MNGRIINDVKTYKLIINDPDTQEYKMCYLEVNRAVIRVVFAPDLKYYHDYIEKHYTNDDKENIIEDTLNVISFDEYNIAYYLATCKFTYEPDFIKICTSESKNNSRVKYTLQFYDESYEVTNDALINYIWTNMQFDFGRFAILFINDDIVKLYNIANSLFPNENHEYLCSKEDTIIGIIYNKDISNKKMPLTVYKSILKTLHHKNIVLCWSGDEPNKKILHYNIIICAYDPFNNVRGEIWDIMKKLYNKEQYESKLPTDTYMGDFGVILKAAMLNDIAQMCSIYDIEVHKDTNIKYVMTHPFEMPIDKY